MTDEKIAELLAAARVLLAYDNSYGRWYYRSTDDGVNREHHARHAGDIIEDWRTAGLCLEHPDFYYAVEKDERGKYFNGQHYGRRAGDGSLPRTICEAFARAQSEQDGN